MKIIVEDVNYKEWCFLYMSLLCIVYICLFVSEGKKVRELQKQVDTCYDKGFNEGWADGNDTGSALGKWWAIEWAIGQGAARFERPGDYDFRASGVNGVNWSHEFLSLESRAKYHALGWHDMEPREVPKYARDSDLGRAYLHGKIDGMERIFETAHLEGAGHYEYYEDDEQGRGWFIWHNKEYYERNE